MTNSITTYANQQQSDGDKYLPFCTFAYNTAKHESLKVAPFTFVFRHQAVLLFNTPNTTITLAIPNDYYTQLLRFLREAKSTVTFNVKQQQQQHVYKRRYDTDC